MESVKEDISKLYTINDFAAIKNIDRRTVYNWMLDPDKYNIIVVTISGKKFIKFKKG